MNRVGDDPEQMNPQIFEMVALDVTVFFSWEYLSETLSIWTCLNPLCLFFYQAGESKQKAPLRCDDLWRMQESKSQLPGLKTLQPHVAVPRFGRLVQEVQSLLKEIQPL